MEEDKFNSIINEYYDFRTSLSDNINNSSISLNNELCYLIEENWFDNLKEGFNEYKNLKKRNKLSENFDYYDLLPEIDPKFINNFSIILKSIKDNKKLRCISKKLLELIYDKNDLKDYNYIKYYSGNNKLIIEYENDNKAILLIDPFNQKEIKNNINIILIKDKEKKQLFENILSSKNKFPNKNFNNIMPIDIYLNKLNNIMKLFIYFYYYEKDLKENQAYIFSDNGEDYYYLINPEWLNKFKDIFNYSDVYKFLNLIDTKEKIYYDKLNHHYEYITSKINENILNKKKELFDDIFSGEQVKSKSAKLNNIIYHKNCYIINSQIMNIIKSIFNDNEINIKSKRIFYANNNIYLVYDKKVIIGKLNEQLLFNPKYIIVYDSNEIFESEKKYLLAYTIKKYLYSLKCDLSNSNLQILKVKNNIICKCIVLNVTKSINKNDNQQKNKSVPKNNTNSFQKIRTENHNLNQRTNNYSYEKNCNNQYEEKNINYNSIKNANNIKITNNKIRESNKKKKNYKIKKFDIKINEEQINNNDKDNLSNNHKIDKLINNDFKKKYPEEIEENINFNNKREKHKKLNENNEFKKQDNENLSENELINSPKNMLTISTDQGRSFNDDEEMNKHLREQDNIIIEYENKNKKMENESKEKDDKLKDIQKELENKNNEIININKNLDERQNYIKELEYENREKENEIKKIKLKNDEEYQKLNELLNKAKEENKNIKQINLKRKKKLEEQIKINDELKIHNNELINKIEELEKNNDESNNIIEELKENNRIKEERIKELENEKKVIMKNSNKMSQMKKKYNSEIQRYKDEIDKLVKENNILNQKCVLIENELKDVNKNEIINSDKKLQEKINDLEKSINNYKEINNKLREKENEIKKLKNLNDEYQKIKESFNKSKEENKKIKQINIKMRKKLEEQYKINDELKNNNSELNNKIKELENEKNEIINKINNDSKNKISQMKNEYDSKSQRYIDEINELKKIIKKREANNNEQINDKKRRELDERENIIKMKENEINKKISFLEDKENLIEKENKEIEIKRRELEKEIENNKRALKNSKKIDNSKNHLKIYKNPLDIYKNPPLIGLNNIGATCFMNSTLQCLSQTKELTFYFLKEENEKKIINNNIALVNKNAYQLSPIYLELIKQLWDEKGEISFSPYNFMNVVEKMNPLFKQGQAGDSKDFIIFILEQLHKELKKPVNNGSNII